MPERPGPAVPTAKPRFLSGAADSVGNTKKIKGVFSSRMSRKGAADATGRGEPRRGEVWQITAIAPVVSE